MDDEKPPIRVPKHLRDTWYVPLTALAALALYKCQPDHTPPESIPAYERDKPPAAPEMDR